MDIRIDKNGVHPRWLLLNPIWLIKHLRVLRVLKKLKEVYCAEIQSREVEDLNKTPAPTAREKE